MDYMDKLRGAHQGYEVTSVIAAEGLKATGYSTRELLKL